MKSGVIFLVLFIAATAGFLYWQKPADNPLPQEHEVAGEIQDFVNRTMSENREATSTEETTKKSPTPSSSPPTSQGETRGEKEFEEEDDKEVIFVCIGEKDRDFDCYQDYYKEAVKRQGIAGAFGDLKGRYAENDYVRSQCHPLTHVIGYEASKKFADVAEAYTQGDAYCWSGYYHGVLEGVIAQIGYDKLFSQLNGICNSLAEKNKYSFDHYNCVHGLGHGIMAIRNNELFESLEICDTVTDSWERVSCWSGAFMENIIFDEKYHNAKYLKPAEPMYPCTAVSDKYKENCYMMQTSYALRVVNRDFAKVFEMCGGIEENYRNICYQSLGRDISGQSISDVAKTKTNCNLGKTAEQRENCVIGAVKDFISYLHSDTRAKELCASLEEMTVQETCYRITEAYYKIF